MEEPLYWVAIAVAGAALMISAAIERLRETIERRDRYGGRKAT